MKRLVILAALLPGCFAHRHRASNCDEAMTYWAYEDARRDDDDSIAAEALGAQLNQASSNYVGARTGRQPATAPPPEYSPHALDDLLEYRRACMDAGWSGDGRSPPPRPDD